QPAVAVASVDVSGVLYPPACAKTDTRTATPNTPPSSRIAFVAPEALPSCSGATELSTTFATGAKNRAIPAPETTNGATRSAYDTVGDSSAARKTSPVACSARPSAINRWPPTLSDSAPAIGEMKTGI